MSCRTRTAGGARREGAALHPRSLRIAPSGASGSTGCAAPVELILWGGGSKAVAFLTTLDVREGIEYAVDINPRRSGTFLAGTGQEIVAPGSWRTTDPTW